MSEEGFRDPPEPQPEPKVPAAPPPDERVTNLPDGGVRYVLREPIMAPGKKGMEELKEIVCRRPTGADMLAGGNPVVFDPARAQITHDMDRMPDMIFRLSGVSLGVLRKLTSEDLTGLCWAVTRFFLPPVGSI